jgi:four helix bundle protein
MVCSFPKNPAAYIIGKQIIRSATSIGANITEAQGGLTKNEFIHSMNIAKKEAKETEYWTNLIIKTSLIKENRVKSLLKENKEIIGILTTIIVNSKKRK